MSGSSLLLRVDELVTGYEPGVPIVRGASLSVAAGEAEILNLAVDPANRRLGIAGALFHEALAEFRRLRIIRVFLEVRESNLAAISFYEKCEFIRTGGRPGYYQQPREAAVLLMRKLTRN